MGKQEISKIENFNVNALEEIKGKEKLIESVIKENPFVKIVDNKTYEEGKKSRTALRTCRTDLEKEEKALHNAVKKVLTEPIKNIYGGFKEKVIPLEDKQQEEVKAWEDVKEQERQEKLRIEEARKQKHRDNIELVFNHNKKLIDELNFENLPHELVFKIDNQEFTSESFEEFADVFEAKVDVLTTMLKDKINTLQEKENIRLENERLENERKENERKQNIRTLIDVFYSKWHELFTEMGFEDIKEVSLNFNSEKPIDCAEFQDEYATKRASLVRMLEAKTNFLTQAEKQRIQQEKLDREQAELEQLNRDLEAKQKKLEEVIPEPTLKDIISEEKSPFEIKVNTRIEQLISLGLNFDFDSSYVGFNFIIDVLDIKTYDDSKWSKLITQIEEVKSKQIITEPQVNEIEVVDAEIVSGNNEEVNVEENSIKQIILNTISDLCSDFLYYDRKNDEDLSIEKLNEAVVNGFITIDEMIDEFRKHLVNTFS